jgi:protein TonB
LVFTTLAFLVLPKEFVVEAYKLRRSVETIMESLPPTLEELAKPPEPAKPAVVPVAAASEAEVTASTIDPTNVVEVVRRTEETDIPVVPFWKVEVKPKPINIPVPTYPDMARTAGIEGQAVVEALVDVDGSVADARILKSSGNTSLDQAAVDAALRSKFSPAYQRDQAVRVWVSIPFRFTLMN